MKPTLTLFKRHAIVLLGSLVLFSTSCEKQALIEKNATDGDPVILEKTTSSYSVSYVANEYFVDVVPGRMAAAILGITLNGGTVINQMDEIDLVQVHATNKNFERDVEKLSSVNEVTPSIEIDFLGGESHAMAPSSVLSGISGANPVYGLGLQWSHTAINSENAWNMGETGAGAVVAVLDGGFYPNHPDIAANVLEATSFVPGEGAERAGPDGFSHGTHVAGIIAAADNDVGCLGVAPDASLRLIKVLPDAGSGPFGPILQGIIYAANIDDVDIMNMSLGGIIPKAAVPPQVMWDLRAFLNYVNKGIQYANQQGKIVIVSAGNSAIDPQRDGYWVVPVGAPQAFGVSALGPNNFYDDWVNGTSNANYDLQAYYTNTGIQTVDVAGSGGNIDPVLLAAYYNSGGTDGRVFYDMVLSPSGMSSYYWAQGTSMSSPQVAGVAALIVGKYGRMSPKSLKAKLYQCADDLGKPGVDDVYGQGRVNAYNAVK